jgi:hypothetical protein
MDSVRLDKLSKQNLTHRKDGVRLDLHGVRLDELSKQNLTQGIDRVRLDLHSVTPPLQNGQSQVR